MDHTKWEYRILNGSWPFAMFRAELADLGLKGWEAVSLSNYWGLQVVLLKRPLP